MQFKFILNSITDFLNLGRYWNYSTECISFVYESVHISNSFVRNFFWRLRIFLRPLQRNRTKSICYYKQGLIELTQKVPETEKSCSACWQGRELNLLRLENLEASE